MVAARQLPHSSALIVMSYRGDFKRILNSRSATSSSLHFASDSFRCVSSGKGHERQSSWKAKELHGSGDRISSNVFSVSLQNGRCGLELRSISALNAQQQHYFSLKCAAASDETAASENETEKGLELPLFPLPLVLFPGAILPLQIFEFRYRIMMHTLLQTDLRFGVVYTDKSSGMAGVGCVGEVVKHERLVDSRFFMICKGQERFRVMDILRTKPYVVARVEWLEDRPSGEQEDVEALADEVESFMKDVIRLSNRVNGKPEKTPPDDLRKNLFPTPFSFWVGSTFEGAPVEQQALLELKDTAQRLKREKETLRNTLNYLSAASAVKDVFPFSD